MHCNTFIVHAFVWWKKEISFNCFYITFYLTNISKLGIISTMLGLSLKLYCEEDRFNEHLSKLTWSVGQSRTYWTLFKHCHNLLMPKSLPAVTLLTDDV